MKAYEAMIPNTAAWGGGGGGGGGLGWAWAWRKVQLLFQTFRQRDGNLSQLQPYTMAWQGSGHDIVCL